MNNLKKMLKLANEMQENLKSKDNLKQFLDLSDKIFFSIHFPDSEIISGLQTYAELFQELNRAVQASELDPKIKEQIEFLADRSTNTANMYMTRVNNLRSSISSLKDDKFTIDDVLKGRYLEEDFNF